MYVYAIDCVFNCHSTWPVPHAIIPLWRMVRYIVHSLHHKSSQVWGSHNPLMTGQFTHHTSQGGSPSHTCTVYIVVHSCHCRSNEVWRSHGIPLTTHLISTTNNRYLMLYIHMLTATTYSNTYIVHVHVHGTMRLHDSSVAIITDATRLWHLWYKMWDIHSQLPQYRVKISVRYSQRAMGLLLNPLMIATLAGMVCVTWTLTAGTYMYAGVLYSGKFWSGKFFAKPPSSIQIQHFAG